MKGKSGNPAGRKPRATEERYLELTRQAVTEADWKAVVMKAVDQAKRGDANARKFLADYLIGPPAQKHDVDVNGRMMLIWDMPTDKA